jgi:hypothetical protein
MVAHRKLQENIPLNISSRPCSALRNYDMGTTPSEVQHALVNTKQKQKKKKNHEHKRKTYTPEAVLPTSHNRKMQPAAFCCYECYKVNASCKTDMR